MTVRLLIVAGGLAVLYLLYRVGPLAAGLIGGTGEAVPRDDPDYWLAVGVGMTITFSIAVLAALAAWGLIALAVWVVTG